MLVLTRFRNQCIDIGTDVRITVVEVRGGKVRIGIDAPKDVRIIRTEIDKPDKDRKNVMK